MEKFLTVFVIEIVCRDWVVKLLAQEIALKVCLNIFLISLKMIVL